jgi:CPA1 family monovalent cation:H+ antiporter
MPEQLFALETIIIELLLVISVVAIIVSRLQLPYTVALVAVGLGLSLLESDLETELTEELILAIFVPPLIFEAAFQIDFSELRRNLPSILTYAIPGVILTMFIVAGVMIGTTNLPLEVALVFGALIAATDPVAIISLFRTLGVPGRLGILVEGESLFNDGTAIVIFNVMLGVAVTGEFSMWESLLDFIRVVVGGLAIGVGTGSIIAWIIARVDDHLIEITLTTVLAFGSYLLAEELHFSGVLAVVAAGLLNGNLSAQGMSPTTRIILNNFWEYVAFLANSFVFLLIGLDVNLPDVITAWRPVALAIMAVLLARVIVIYGLGLLVNRSTIPIPLKWQHVMAWGGLRGAISLALALSLPFTLRDRDLLQEMTFGVVLFTLFIQGLTISPLLRLLGITFYSEKHVEYETEHAKLVAVQASRRHLQQLRENGTISDYTMRQLHPEMDQRIEDLRTKVQELLEENPELAAEDLIDARISMLRAERNALLELKRAGVITQDAYENVVVDIDEKLSKLQTVPH